MARTFERTASKASQNARGAVSVASIAPWELKIMCKTLIAAAFLFALPLSVAAENVCEDVNAVANLWNDFANMLHESQGDGFTEGEVHDIADTLGEMAVATGELATLLHDGNDTQVKLGQQLEAALVEFEKLTGEAKADYAVSVTDDLVAAIDVVTDDCDAHASH